MTQQDVVVDEARRDEERRPGRKRDHSRDPEILAATLDVLAEVGYDGMTVDMVAARVKAGKATLYRRWPSKQDLVLDAVVCMKRDGSDPADLPDTGSLRGDMLALIRPHSVEESERKLQVMAGLLTMLARDPKLAEAVNAAMTEPRAALNRVLLRRAIERGEIDAGVDVDRVAHIGPAMTAYRVLVQREPVSRGFLIGLIDGVVLPAFGLSAERAPATV